MLQFLLQNRFKAPSSQFPHRCLGMVDERSETGDKKKSPRKALSEFLTENCAMREPKLEVSLWGFRINAVGPLAVCAAVLIFFAVLAAWRL
jgi:hypothetical protein